MLERNQMCVCFVSVVTASVLQSDYAMEIYRSLNNTDEDPPGEQVFGVVYRAFYSSPFRPPLTSVQRNINVLRNKMV